MPVKDAILQAWAVDLWISGGAPRSKLIMGLTGTATSFTLTNKTLTDVGSPVTGPGKQGPYLFSSGHVTYYKVLINKRTYWVFNLLLKRR